MERKAQRAILTLNLNKYFFYFASHKNLIRITANFIQFYFYTIHVCRHIQSLLLCNSSIIQDPTK